MIVWFDLYFRCCLVPVKTYHEFLLNKEGVESFKIGKDKTGAGTYDTIYIKDNNSVAESSGDQGVIVLVP
jgi:hypothetical protein